MTEFIPDHYEILILSVIITVLGKLINWGKTRGFPRILVIFLELVLFGLVGLMGYSVYFFFT